MGNGFPLHHPSMAARGLRNNNPGNIRESANDKTQWVGERATDDDPAFEEFIEASDGIRALAVILRNYQRTRGLKTITQLIHRWAPSNENDTAAYVNAVSKSMGVAPDHPLDLSRKATMAPLVKAIIQHENGTQPYSDEYIDRAIGRAGCE